MTAIAEHPVFGAHWLSTNCIVPELVEAIIRSHHETLDGKGYPDGKNERELPRASMLSPFATTMNTIRMSFRASGA
jgi:HD-GYP domain-containing protein (c-di-GMP phosphodiesterase class II)